MNVVTLIGRVSKDVYYKEVDGDKKLAKYTLAVPKYEKGNKNACDFISCVAWGRLAEFARDYLEVGVRLAVRGRITTGKYVNADGRTIYTTEVNVEEQEFAQSKSERKETVVEESNDGFMDVAEGVDEELPFN